MSRHEFVDFNGTVWRCVHAEGRDPLLARWRDAEYGTHPTWHNPLFWKSVADHAEQDGFEAARRAAKRNAGKEDGA